MNTRYYLEFLYENRDEWSSSVLWPDGMENFESAKAVALLVADSGVEVRIIERLGLTEPIVSIIEHVIPDEGVKIDRF